jgi:hypothetical protein
MGRPQRCELSRPIGQKSRPLAHTIRGNVLFRWLAAASCIALLAAAQPAAPKRFAPFALPHGTRVMDAAFTQDGGTLYLTRVAGRTSYAIVVSQRSGESWSPPLTVPFSGRWRDLEEVLSPDGDTMIFSSNRPGDASGKPLDAYYNGSYSHARGGNLWIVKPTRSGWGAPVRLPDGVNANTSTFSPAIDAHGTLYFMRASGPGGRFHLFTARREHGVYASSSLAPFSDMRYADFDPTIAPDGSFVIFTSTRPPAPSDKSALFISFRQGSGWTVPRDMGAAIDPAGDAVEARLSTDAEKLYYSSRRAVWTVDLHRWLTLDH